MEIFITLGILYLVPSFIAAYKKKKNGAAILAVNLLLGWTFVGWVVALVWALTHEDKPADTLENN